MVDEIASKVSAPGSGRFTLEFRDVGLDSARFSRRHLTARRCENALLKQSLTAPHRFFLCVFATDLHHSQVRCVLWSFSLSWAPFSSRSLFFASGMPSRVQSDTSSHGRHLKFLRLQGAMAPCCQDLHPLIQDTLLELSALRESWRRDLREELRCFFDQPPARAERPSSPYSVRKPADRMVELSLGQMAGPKVAHTPQAKAHSAANQ